MSHISTVKKSKPSSKDYQIPPWKKKKTLTYRTYTMFWDPRSEASTTTFICPNLKCQDREQLAHGHKVCQWQSEDRMPANLIPATDPVLEILLAKLSFSKDWIYIFQFTHSPAWENNLSNILICSVWKWYKCNTVRINLTCIIILFGIAVSQLVSGQWKRRKKS